MPREFKPSPQQAAYFAWVETGTGSCVLEAVAGAGKTTTLLRSTKMMPGNVAFMAYSNAAAKDIRAKADEGGYSRPDMRIGTVHSFCNKAWRYMAPDLGDPDENKVPNIIASLIEQATPEQAAKLESWKHVIKRLVSVGKSFLMGVPDMANPQVTRQRAVTNLGVWAKLAEHFSVFDDLPEDSDTTEILQLVVDVFEVSASMCHTVIDFDDMIYEPLRFRARFFKQDWVLGDEWQDANPARREAVRRMLKPGGRAIFVGDSRQAIFGFTGARR
jgi:superfamily I DNA/RNA helicase